MTTATKNEILKPIPNMILKNNSIAGTEKKKSPSSSFTRRGFLKTSSFAAAATAIGALDVSRSAYRCR